jgi:sugar-specific transcriptional regulator TrmB
LGKVVYQDKDAQTFTRLGLTFLQSKVYLTLIGLDEATIKTISENSRVARQELYRITSELEEEGLIERIIGAPTRFKAIPPYDGLSILLQRQDRKNKEVQISAEKLLHRYRYFRATNGAREQAPHFILVPKRETLIKRLRDEIEEAEKSIDLITTVERLLQAMQYFYANYAEALRRNVKIRVVTGKAENKKPFPTKIKSLITEANFELRYIFSPPKAYVTIFDKKEAFVTLYPDASLKESPAINTSHNGFLAILQDHFESVWNTATKYKS